MSSPPPSPGQVVCTPIGESPVSAIHRQYTEHQNKSKKGHGFNYDDAASKVASFLNDMFDEDKPTYILMNNQHE
jgi:hypothetical protein